MPKKKDIIDYIMDYEMGHLSDIETIYLFRDLIKNGMAWSLQGHYGRTANKLIESEYLLANGDINEGKLEDIGIL
tara:strand:- start:1387 stop:1611 length:225 start_codon:yes stop_codon:yes gene_type:complete